MASDVHHVDVSSEDLRLDKNIRKLRKKLRQIEHLELLSRTLSEEEELKVQSKLFTRQELLSLLSEVNIKDDRKENHSNVSSLQAVDDSRDVDTSTETDNSATFHHSAHGDAEKCEETAILPKGQQEKKAPSEGNEAATEKQSDPIAKDSSNASGLTAECLREKSNPVEKNLLSSNVEVSALDGHSDIITAVIIEENILVTASRDTTVKCWDMETGKELRSLGSHIESVTCLAIVPTTNFPHAFSDSGGRPQEALIASGSWDCTVKLWALHSGKLLNSIYTFSPVTQVTSFAHTGRLVTGSDGGKLEFWDMADKTNFYSTRAFDAAVVGIKVDNTLVYSCAANGVIQVHDASDDGNLKCLFVSDNLRSVDGRPMALSHIRGVELVKGTLLIGQDSNNVKLVNWRKGSVAKLRNHQTPFSFTDAICYHDDMTLTSSYDLDSGHGSVNVRCGPVFKYSCTLDDEETGRILCLDFLRASHGRLVVVTAGVELKVWKLFPASQPPARSQDKVLLKVKRFSSLAKPAVDSESDEDDEDNDADDDSDSEGDDLQAETDSRRRPPGGGVAQENGSWLSWCSVL